MAENLTIKERYLDFSECSYIGEIYAVIKKELELPEWCGENLDALWDALTGMMYTPASIIINIETKKKDLQQSVNDIVTVFREAEEEYHEITVSIKK
jgi:ribonuclease inhibitor